jgi:hypothetical protein
MSYIIPGPPAPAPDGAVMKPRGTFVAGQAATIFVDFHSNPGPTSIMWYLGKSLIIPMVPWKESLQYYSTVERSPPC